MKRTFVIDADTVTVNVEQLNMSAELLDVVTVGSRSIEELHPGRRRVYICGHTDAGMLVDGTFRIVGKSDQDVLVLESIENEPVVGRRE